MALGTVVARSALVGLILIGVLVIGTATWRWNARERIRASQGITSANGIEKLEAPMINGVRQWLHIRGQDVDNPVIVFIHGGPKNPMMPWAHLYQSLWEEHFTVVQWDQRGVGKSYLNPDTGEVSPMGETIQLYVDDASAVINHVLTLTEKEKVIVIGHSWGSIVGLRLASQRPDLLHAYVGTGQVLDLKAAEKKSNELSLAAARSAQNQQAISALEAIQPYPESLERASTSEERAEIFMTARLWVSKLLPHGRGVFSELVVAPFKSPVYSLSEAYRFLMDTQDPGIIDLPLFGKMLEVEFPATGLVLDVPIFFLEGRHDHFTESSVVARFIDRISAPSARLFWLEDSGHFGMIQQPEEYRDILVEHVRPVAVASPP